MHFNHTDHHLSHPISWFMCTCLHVFACKSVYIYIYIYVCVCVCVCECVCECVCVCVCACVYVCDYQPCTIELSDLGHDSLELAVAGRLQLFTSLECFHTFAGIRTTGILLYMRESTSRTMHV